MIQGSQDELKILKARKEKENKLLESVKDIEGESRVFEKIVDKLVSEFCYDLDTLTEILWDLIQGINKGKIRNYSELKLEVKSIEISLAMYKATEGLSILGSRSDVAKAKRSEKFDEIYSTIYEGTIHDKKALANKQMVEEMLLDKIMERSYKTISQKIKSANRVLESMKKVLTSQMINKEVFRKESPAYDQIDANDDLEDGDLVEEGEL